MFYSLLSLRPILTNQARRSILIANKKSVAEYAWRSWKLNVSMLGISVDWSTFELVTMLILVLLPFANTTLPIRIDESKRHHWERVRNNFWKCVHFVSTKSYKTNWWFSCLYVPKKNLVGNKSELSLKQYYFPGIIMCNWYGFILFLYWIIQFTPERNDMITIKEQ